MKKLTKVDLATTLFLLFFLFFLRYRRVFYIEWYYIDFILMTLILIRTIYLGFRFDVIKFISFFLLLLVVSLNIVKFGFGDILIGNLLMQLMPLTLISFLIYLKRSYEHEVLTRLTYKLTIFMNLYFFINAAIILIQIKTGTFMMERFLIYNPNAFDHMTGLIGMNGVSVLNFFWIATILLNLFFYLERKSLKILIIIILEVIIAFSFSLFNDNKMIFLTFTFFVGLFFYFRFLSSGLSFKNINRVFRIVIFLIAILVCLFIFKDKFGPEFNNTFNLINDFFSKSGLYPNKNNERAYLNYLAFHYYNASGMGIGLNNVDLLHQSIHVHLGINSSSLVMILGGWIYLVVLVNIYTVYFVNLISIKGRRNKITIYLIIFLSVLFVSYATQPFRDHYIIAMLSLICFSYYLSMAKTDKVAE